AQGTPPAAEPGGLRAIHALSQGLPAPVFFCLLATLAAVSPVELVAQEPVDPALEGQVVRNDQPMPSTTVNLHRVSPGAAGQVDSTRTGEEGRFRFTLPTVPGSDPEGGDVYFASVRHDGVLYFGQAINQTAQLDSVYRIEVHDTVSASPRGRDFPIVARNLLLEETDEGWTVVDLFRIQNEGDRTVVAREGGIVWSHPLPASATDFQPGESDLAPDAVVFADGEIRVSSPTPPGERSYIMRYELADLPFTIPVSEGTQRVEMLIREPAPPLTVSGLQQLEPVSIEPESSYRRFAAAEPTGQDIEISEGDEGGMGEVAWFAVVLGLVLAAGAVYAVQTRPRAAPGRGRHPTRNELLLEIAELDAAFQGREDLSAEARARYEDERKRLKERLAELHDA
ncbi:MAG: hypothetical protein ACOC5J_02740, partial [Gemmatimonadota bacterium]